MNTTREKTEILEDQLRANLVARDQNNPKEIAIRSRIQNLLLQHSWIDEAFTQVTKLQQEHLHQAVDHIRAGEHKQIHHISQRIFSKVSQLFKSHVASNEDEVLLSSIERNGPVIFTTNHLGLYKLCGIETNTFDVLISGYPRIYPYWAYSAGLYPLANLAGMNLTYVSNQFPGIFHDIHQASGFVHVPFFDEKGIYCAVEAQVLEIIEKTPNTAIVYFPEGTTSGKPNESDPYHLAPFRRGAYALASNLELPRVLVGQFFHPHEGLILKVLDVSRVPLTHEPKITCAEFAKRDQLVMQEWLDSMVAEAHPELLALRIKQ